MGRKVTRKPFSILLFFKQGIMTEFDISGSAASYVVCINSGDIDSAYHYLRTGKPLPGMKARTYFRISLGRDKNKW